MSAESPFLLAKGVLTILDFPDAGFQVVQRQVANLVSKAVEIHFVGNNRVYKGECLIG